MRIRKYLQFFSDPQKKLKITRYGIVRILTTCLAIFSLAGMIVTYCLQARMGFFICIVFGIAIFAINSVFERTFNKVVISCIEGQSEASIDDNMSLIRNKCFNRYGKYTEFLKKGNKAIMLISLIFAAICITFGILMFTLSGKAAGLSFVITSLGILIYVFIQIVYFILSFAKENEFFDSCKGDISLLRKNSR